MKHIHALLFVIGGLFLGGVGNSSPIGETRPLSLFCPDCWKFITDPADVDLGGLCSRTGKKPVEVEAVSVGWVWCRLHHAWHRKPCAKEQSLGFLESKALLVPAGSQQTSFRAYCPEDRMMSDIGRVGQKCPVCARPFVEAEAVVRRWYWCGSEKAWLAQPCPANARLRCCAPRSGFILAYPWQVPFLSDVSYKGSAREDMRVSPQWLAEHLNDPHLIVIHVSCDRSDPGSFGRPSYLDGHIPGARKISWNEIAVDKPGRPNVRPPAEYLVQMVRSLGIRLEDRVVLYDNGWGLEAARAYVMLDYLGLGGKVALLDGQWEGWKALQLPVARMPDEVEPSAFVPRLHPEIFIPISAMKDLSWLAQEPGHDLAILDARSSEEYSGMKAGKGVLRAGHIAGAANLCWTQMVDTGSEPRLRSELELKALFEAAGAGPDRSLVTYCRTGVEASLIYFVAKYLGYSVQMYEGSYVEWSHDEDLPIKGNWARK